MTRHSAPTTPTAPASATVAVLAALGVVLSLLLAPSVYADEPAPTTIALAAPAMARLTSTIQLDAVVQTGASPNPGEAVTFERQSGPERWTSVGTVATDSSGHARQAWTVSSGTSVFRAVLAATDTHPQLVSDGVTITGYKARSLLTMSATSWSVIDERSRSLRVSWSAESDPVDAIVSLQARRRGQAWRTVARSRTGSDGITTFTVRPRYDTYFRVSGPAGASWLGTTSAVRLLDNRPASAPVRYPARAPRPKSMPLQRRGFGPGANPVATRIPNGVWRQMRGRSWHPGCPVGRSQLRLIRINYWGYDGYRYRGELVVRTAIVRKTIGVFRDMYRGRYPIRRMYRVDRFGWSRTLHGANDYASMARGNTSGFNCRGVVGNPRARSPHSYGRAIDINTWENPYVSQKGIVPNRWWHRHSHPRIAWRHRGHPVLRILAKHGFRWTYGNGDSQHADGRLAATSGPTVIG